jgi:hypothetical protein
MKQDRQRLQLAPLEIVSVVLGFVYTMALVAFGVQSGSVGALLSPPFLIALGSAVALLLGQRSLARAFQIILAIGFLLASLAILGFAVICTDRATEQFWGPLALGIAAFFLAILHNACGHAIKRQMDTEG